MRRFVVAMMLLGVIGVASPGWAQSPPPVPTVGIRIIDVPTVRSEDPRARQYVVDHLAPGVTITRRLAVTNGTRGPVTVQLYAAAADITGGSFTFGAGRAANELTGWTSVDPPSVSPAAGATAVVTLKIAVPANASPGERYGVVWAELAAAAPASGGVTSVNRVGVRIYLSVGPGGEPPSDFSITAFEARRAADGTPSIAATVRNTGGRAVDLSGELRLANGPGGLSAGPFPAKLGTTLGLGQTEPVIVNLDPAIPKGPWTAHIVLRSGALERQADATVTFPDAGAPAPGPVATRNVTKESSGVPLAAGGAAAGLIVVASAAALLVTRRQRSQKAR